MRRISSAMNCASCAWSVSSRRTIGSPSSLSVRRRRSMRATFSRMTRSAASTMRAVER
jgi:hypothetical protein